MMYQGKRVTMGTGQDVWPDMYTIAKLDTHLGKEMWFVHRQTNDGVHAILAYLELRRIHGDNAQIAIIPPNKLLH